MVRTILLYAENDKPDYPRAIFIKGNSIKHFQKLASMCVYVKDYTYD